MRTFVLLVAAVMTAVCFSALPAAGAPTTAPSAAAALTIPRLYIQVIGQPSGTSFTFTPAAIIIPQVPIILNITFYNNQPVSTLTNHTFTIDDTKGNHVINFPASPQTNVTFQFTINSMTNVTFANRSFQPGPPPSGTDNGTIQFYCIPHVTLGMKGSILLGSAVPPAAPEQNGIFLRAYWIGLIGIAAMLVWIGISYYIIKGSSPRFRDHREHVRKGLP